MGSHYIPVGKLKIDKSILDLACPAAGYDSTPPPPEIYCPAEGYIRDPEIYDGDKVINDELENNPPGEGEITLLVKSEFDYHLYFRVVTSAGQYNVKIYDPKKVLVSSFNQNSGTYFSENVPEEDAYYRYVISGVSGNITAFRAYTRTNFDSDGANIMAAFINAPELTTCDQMFYNIKKIKHIEFLCDCNLVGSFYRMCYNNENLEFLRFPASANIATNFQESCRNTFNLVKVILPTVMPNAETFQNAFSDSYVKGEIVFPSVMPNLRNLFAFAYGAIYIRKIQLPVSAPSLQNLAQFAENAYELESANIPPDATEISNLQYVFHNNYKLKGKFIFPEMKGCTNVQYSFENCYEIEELEFQGEMDLAITMNNWVTNCKKLKKFTMPESMKGVISRNNFNPLGYNPELETLILPKYLNDTVEWTGVASYLFLGRLADCGKLKIISKIETSYDDLMGTINYTQLFSLEEFDQPNLRISNGTLAPFGTAVAPFPGKLEYFEIDWKYLNNVLNLMDNALPGTEILRILDQLPVIVPNANSMSVRFSGNPGVDELGLKTVACRGFTDGNTVTLSAGHNVEVGSNLLRNGISYNIKTEANSTTNEIETNTKHGFAAGKKMAITNSVTDVGIEYGKEYYVINPTDYTFQIAETVGGAAVNFTNNSNDLTICIPVKIIDIVGNTAYLDCFALSSSQTAAVCSENVDFFKLNKKGWHIS